jgi:hypothetical protein
MSIDEYIVEMYDIGLGAGHNVSRCCFFFAVDAKSSEN